MKKKLISLALGMSVMAAVAGCSSKPKETEKATEAKTEAAAQTEAATEAAAVEEAVSEAAAAVEEAVSEAAETAEEAVTEAAEAVSEAVVEVEEAVTEAAEAEVETEAVTEAAETEEETEAVTEEAVVVTEIDEAETEEVTEAGEELAVAVPAVVEAETEEVTEEATEVQTEEATEEVTEAQTEEATEEATEAQTEEAVEAATEAAEEVEDVTESVTEEDEWEDLDEDETEDLSELADLDATDIDFQVELENAATRGTVDDFEITEDDVVILYNNDVHGGISADKDYSGSALSLGYAGMAGVKADVEEKAADVTTVDLGDAIQGSVVTTETNGHAAMDLMEMVDYDILIPGNHEFDYGMDAFLDYAANVSAEFISANFIDNRTGEAVLDGYTIEYYEVNGLDLAVGYVGMSTPETIAKSTPTYFQDEDGNYIYGFNAETPQDLYDCVQASIDAAYAEGADIVIGLAHLGDSGVEEVWSSRSVIANTTGLTAVLDGHAHNIVAGELVQNKDGQDVLLSTTGTKLEHIGLMKLNVTADGVVTVSTGLVDEITDAEKETAEYNELYAAVQEIEDQFAYLFVVEGTTDYDLVVYDPETGDRLIRNAETNLGDFLSDVYRNHFGADIGVINGGSIRANIDAGDINYMDLITVYPWNTTTGVIEVSGQVVLDMLEMGAHLYPEECGGWIQPSGLTYMLDTTIDSSVNVNSDGEFVSVDGEYRVKNVEVNGEPLDLDKTYTMAINTYYSQEYGDGMTMFKGCKVVVPAEGEDEIVDHDVVIDYLKEIGGEVPEEYADPYGQGRFIIITEENKDLLDAAEEAVTEAAAEEAEAVTEAVTE